MTKLKDKFNLDDMVDSMVAPQNVAGDTVEDPVVEPVVTEDVIEDDPTEDPLVENPVVEDIVEDVEDKPVDDKTEKPEDLEAQSAKVEEDSEIDAWDSDVTPEGDVDSTRLLSDIGIEASDIDSAKEYISGLRTKIEELESADALEGLPDDLSGAVEIFQKGGDYLEYLNISAVDYENVDARELYIYDLSKYFLDPSTQQVDEERLNDYVDSLSDSEIQIKGTELKNTLIQSQKSRQESIVQETNKKERESQAKLKEAIGKIDSVSNFKLTPAHKQKMYSDISTGEMMKNLYHGEDGELDYNKVVENYFKAAYFDKITKHLRNIAVNQTKKDIVQSVSNVEIVNRGEVVNPTPTDQNLSPMDIAMAHLMGKAGQK